MLNDRMFVYGGVKSLIIFDTLINDFLHYLRAFSSVILCFDD